MSRIRDWVRRLLEEMNGRRGLAGASACALMLLSDWAVAAGGGSHGEHLINWWSWEGHAPPLGWFIFDFVLFAGLLVYLLKKPLANFAKARHEQVKRTIEESQAAHKKAQAHYEEYKEKLARVATEVTSLVEGAKRDGASERDRMIADAKEYASKMARDTEVITQQEVSAAKIRLQGALVNEVLRQSERLLDRELSEHDQQRLVEAAIVELEESVRAGAAA